MAIEIIPNQPVLFRPPTWREPCPCENCDPDCMLVQENDFIYAQVKMNPCGDDLICGQPVSGPELILNGDFATNLDNWTVDTGWAWSAGKACAVNGENIGQTIAAGLVDGNLYIVEFTISNYASNDLAFSLGGTNSGPYNANGNYSVIIAAGVVDDDLIFGGSATFNGCIDNVSVRAYPSCWSAVDVDPEATWTANEDALCISGSLTFVSNVPAAVLGTGNRYVVTFVISNYVSGNVDLQFGSGNLIEGDFTSNGQKFAYESFLTDTQLAFVFDNFFGCISQVHIHRLYPPRFIIENQTTGQQYFDLAGSFVSFVEDRAIVKFQPIEFLFYDCYKICIIDTCLIAGETNEVTNGTFEADLTDWSPGSGWAWSVGNGGQALFDRSVGTGSLSQEFSVSNITVCARITVYDIDGAGAFVRFHLRDAANNSVVFLDITTPGVYSICGFGNQIAVEPSNLAGTIVQVDNIGVFEIDDCEDCSPYDYCSNCIKFAESFESCVLLLESYNNENGSWNFVWNDALGVNVFKLSHRVASKLEAPTYPEESNDYTFSDGTTKDTFGQSDKFWNLGIDPTTERTHDAIRLQKRSDNLIITDINESRSMWAEKGDYNPSDWVGCISPASFKVKLKTSTLYNNLCSE